MIKKKNTAYNLTGTNINTPEKKHSTLRIQLMKPTRAKRILTGNTSNRPDKTANRLDKAITNISPACAMKTPTSVCTS